MSSLTSVPLLPRSNKKKEGHGDVVRPLADFHPTVWGDFFIQSVALPDQKQKAKMEQMAHKLKEEVKMELANARGRLEKEMDLVDAIQRLGLAYHFEEEIEEALVRIHNSLPVLIMDSPDLHLVSLRFRLLRQHGYNVSSSDEFDKFKDVDGHFRESLGSDVKGLLSLYEAAYLGTPADTLLILDEAITFCRSRLQSMLDDDHTMQPHLASEVSRALETPLIRRMRRLEARQYISYYETLTQGQGRNDLILELAKLDFNLLQSLHQEELRNLSVWWKELGIIEKLNFARDRLVEGYVWALGVHYEPNLSRVRMMLTKVIALISLMDDIYDSYGTLEELTLFTSVIQRWGIDVVDELPEYMEIYFVALADTLKAFEEELKDEQKSYRVEYLKEQWKLVASAYFEEAKWSNEGHVPPLEEHLRISLVSCSYPLCTCASFLGLGDIATKMAFDWLPSFPPIVKALSTICRLMDDIMSHEFEQKRQHVASTVQCYMKEYDVSEEKACQKLYEMIEDAWKVINQECLRPSIMPLQLYMPPFNLARMMETYYKHNDGYTGSSKATMCLINVLMVECV